jgi:hypothetical protein
LVGELWVGVEVFVQVLIFTEVRTVLGGDVGDVGHCGSGSRGLDLDDLQSVWK